MFAQLILPSADVLIKQSKLKVLSWVLRGSGGLLWVIAFAALYCKVYEKPFLGWDSAKLDTIATIFFALSPLAFWLSGKLKPKAAATMAAPIMSETRDQRLRRELLKRVKATWGAGKAGGVLSRKWQGDLDGRDVFADTECLRNMALVARNRGKTPLPPGTKMIDVFEKLENQLLILGAPGTGKTTALLELTRSALDRAEQDPIYPIPFVFNLASWSKRQASFEDWLTAELTAQPYSISEKYARSLIEGEHLLLLLDGLDEVTESRREDCVRALNRFRQSHEMTSMAVCSRTEHYTHLKTRIQAGKIILLPLTRQQVQSYLDSAGDNLEGLTKAVRKDEELRELARSPLMLNLLVLTYREMPADLILEELRGRTHPKELFSAYVERILKLKRRGELYTKDQTKRWLAWLAGSMERESSPLFLIEWMQPSLLRGGTLRYIRIVVIVTSLIAYWNLLKNLPLFAQTLGYSSSWPLWMLLVVTAFSFLFGQLCAYIALSRGIRPAEKLNWSWESARGKVIRGFIWVFVLTILLWLAVEFDWLNLRLMAIWLVLGMSGLWGGTWLARYLQKKMVARGHVNSRALLATVYLGPVGLLLGCVIFIVFELIGSPHPDLLANIGRAARVGLIWAGVLLPLNLSLGGMSFRMSMVKLKPNHGIFQSMNNAGIVYILTFVLTLAVFFGVEWATGHWPPAASSKLIMNMPLQLWAAASAVATLMALAFGWLAVIEHFALRFCLYKQGVIPWHYVRFLDYAADRTLLKKVGGGYIFAHRLLQEHFASLEPETAAKVNEGVRSNEAS